MKRIFEHPAPSAGEQLTCPKYWRSLDELAGTPGFQAQLEREFPEGASDLNGVDRRHFMKIMAASFALGGVGLAGCRRPEKFILPYGKSVEGVIPGLPSYYATAMPVRRWAIPLRRDPSRAADQAGKTDLRAAWRAASLLVQASILDLYALTPTRTPACGVKAPPLRRLTTISQNMRHAGGGSGNFGRRIVFADPGASRP